MTINTENKILQPTGNPLKIIKKAMAAYQVMALLFLFCSPVTIQAGPERIEKKVLTQIQTETFRLYNSDRRCTNSDKYRVVLIDNFVYRFKLTPEVSTTHGEMLVKLLKSGRTDIEAKILNTTLSRGLAKVIQDLSDGGCADAVISSIPGSNYTVEQVKSLLPNKKKLNLDTRLADRQALKTSLRQIAFEGFPSVEWVKQADMNLSKLRQDAIKFVFIEALGKFNIPVILPYGNPDTPHKGKQKTINLLSLAENAKVFTGIDAAGRRVEGFPYSPLSSGDETAIYQILECPHPADPSKAMLDINQDGFFDYTFTRNYEHPSQANRCRYRGVIKGTSVIPPHKVKELLPPKQ